MPDFPYSPEVLDRLRWFTDSPDAGDPRCLCSLCLEPIPERESPIMRIWTIDGSKEARLHQSCTAELLPGWVPQYNDEDPDDYDRD